MCTIVKTTLHISITIFSTHATYLNLVKGIYVRLVFGFLIKALLISQFSKTPILYSTHSNLLLL